MFFDIAFESNAVADVTFLIFLDSRGYLPGIDVTCGGANHAAVPDDVRLGNVSSRSRHAVQRLAPDVA